MNKNLYQLLTGHLPFPWQERLYEEWSSGLQNCKKSINLATGVGKTSVIAIWLMLLLEKAIGIPRRLIYVVNRRTVVDQTTEEVLKIIENLRGSEYEKILRENCVLHIPAEECPLAVSTLRGQMADNRVWSADPCRPAVIVGTVDMIGSRLLFNGYRIGFKSRPLHAAFLAQDTLIIHDEAHLEPAFQRLLEGIETEQKKENIRSQFADSMPMIAVALSATSKADKEECFGLTDSDLTNIVLEKRVNARKRLFLQSCEEKDIPEKIAQVVLQHENSGEPVLVFARTVEEIKKIKSVLVSGKENKNRESRICVLTGTIRGHERDNLVVHPVFKRFQPGNSVEANETVYLLCTSAGEVGVNLSGKHLVCDLTTFENMAQRFGRVNRFGDDSELPEEEQTRIDVIYPSTFFVSKSERFNKFQTARKNTLLILKELSDVGPKCLGDIPHAIRIEAFSPEPDLLPLTDILLDNWSLTSIRDPMPGRPPVEPFLHGIDDQNDPPRTSIAWREEVERIKPEIMEFYPPEELLDAYPLKPHEILSDNSKRVFVELGKLAIRLGKKGDGLYINTPIWIINNNGKVDSIEIASLVSDKDNQTLIENKTLLLPPFVGGLGNDGMLEGSKDADKNSSLDVCESWFGQGGRKLRKRTWDPLDNENDWKCIYRIDTSDRESIPDGEQAIENKIWYWYEAILIQDGEGDFSASKLPVFLDDHGKQVEVFAETFARTLGLDEQLIQALKLSGRWHDYGKNRDQWQISIGNSKLQPRLAKSGTHISPIRLGHYRHEFGSLIDIMEEPEFFSLPEKIQDLILHLIAAHHGRGRPHFTVAEATDPEFSLNRAKALRKSIPNRFASLQRRFGRWGLCFLESILRAADYAASSGRNLRH